MIFIISIIVIIIIVYILKSSQISAVLYQQFYSCLEGVNSLFKVVALRYASPLNGRVK